MGDFISDFNSIDDFVSKMNKNIPVNMVSSKRKILDMTDKISVKKNEGENSKPKKKLVQQKLNLTVKEYSKATQQEATSTSDKYILCGHLTSSNDWTQNFCNREDAISDNIFIAHSDETDEFITKMDWSGNKNVDTASNRKLKSSWTEIKVESSHFKKKCLQKKLSLTGNEHSKATQQEGTSAYKEFILHGTSAHENNLDALDPAVLKLSPEFCNFNCISAENLSLKYKKIFPRILADSIFDALEEQVKYFSGDLLKVKVFGKWHNIPRKQACYGDSGLSYSFSGNCFPAQPWNDCDVINRLKKIAESLCKHPFNFVLVNRYKDGQDHMGEHRDDEKDLVKGAPIASMSFGQPRDFIFRHKDSRGPKATRKIPPQKLNLEHGSLLVMESPTNHYWYHSLPVRANAKGVRINLTFRYMVG